MAAKSNQKEGGIRDVAVRKATGKSWNSWFRMLDKAGARTMKHRQIAAMLAEWNPGLGGWWTQMITVAYEQARGLRKKYQKPGGYEIGSTRTIHVPVSRLYKAWSNARSRKRWLDEKVEIRTSTLDKSMRITWSDGKTGLSVNFYRKGDQKSQVAVQHIKLSSAAHAKKMKDFWQERLNDLAALLE